MKIIFYSSLFLILYHIVLYPLILKFLVLFKKEENDNSQEISFYPTITILCPAYNEEKCIAEKIESFINLDYPRDKIELWVLSDDSTDRTNEIVDQYVSKTHNIKLIIQKPRKGKVSAHNKVQPMIKSDYVLSTDANSIFKSDAVNELVKTIQSSNNIGMISGELKLINRNNKDSGEGLYWKYESHIKSLESDFYTIIGANGSIFLVKTELFIQLDDIASVDDFERALYVCSKGFNVKYNCNAIVYEDVTEKPIDELKRKIRIISQEWYALKKFILLLNPFSYFRISWIFVSHKIIRWLLPIWSIGMFISSFILAGEKHFLVLALLQAFFYTGGYFEILLEKKNKSIKVLKMPAYFLIMNIAAFQSILMFIFNKKITQWQTQR